MNLDTDLPQVWGLFNGETGDAANYLRSDPPSMLRVVDFIALATAFVAMVEWFGDAGMALFAPAALTYLLIVAFGRAIKLALRAKQVDYVIVQEQVRAGKRDRPQWLSVLVTRCGWLLVTAGVYGKSLSAIPAKLNRLKPCTTSCNGIGYASRENQKRLRSCAG